MEDKMTFTMTSDSMEAFVKQERDKGISENRIRRYPGYLSCFYRFLPKEKEVDLESFMNFRRALLEKGISKSTVEKYLTCLNGYARFMGAEGLSWKKNMADLRGMEFGYLTPLEPVSKRIRGNVAWRCRCRCGNEYEASAGQLLSGMCKSCGCLRKAVLQKANRYIDGTSLRSSMNDRVRSENLSGFVGVSPKKNKWKAYITFQGITKNLGCYEKKQDAVKARSRAKEAVIEKTEELQKEYDRYLKPIDDMERPKQQKTPRPVLVTAAQAGCRSDNTSGHPGITRSRGQWLVKITWKGVTYYLGRFPEYAEALEVRTAAETMLKADPTAFAQNYENLRRKAAARSSQEVTSEYMDAGSDS